MRSFWLKTTAGEPHPPLTGSATADVVVIGAEATWDCPCHGSRFAVDGSIVSGPALQPLEPHKLPEG